MRFINHYTKLFVGYSKAPEQPHSSARPICQSHYDEHGARTSDHMHCLHIGAHRATHYATGEDAWFGGLDIVHATPLGTGFVDIFIGQIHSESDDQIQ